MPSEEVSQQARPSKSLFKSRLQTTAAKVLATEPKRTSRQPLTQSSTSQQKQSSAIWFAKPSVSASHSVAMSQPTWPNLFTYLSQDSMTEWSYVIQLDELSLSEPAKLMTDQQQIALVCPSTLKTDSNLAISMVLLVRCKISVPQCLEYPKNVQAYYSTWLELAPGSMPELEQPSTCLFTP